MLKEVINDNIFNHLNNIDALMNAANGMGPMGAGIAGAIRKFGGQEIEADAFKVCRSLRPKAGTAYSTISGKLSVKKVVHAVTMERPGGYTSLEIVEKSFLSALKLAEDMGFKTIVCPALGTGVGGLNVAEVAKIMVKISQSSTIDVSIVDVNREFIDSVKRCLEDR